MNKYVIKYDKMAVIFLHRIAVQKTFARFTWKNFSVFHQEGHSPIALNLSEKTSYTVHFYEVLQDF